MRNMRKHKLLPTTFCCVVSSLLIAQTQDVKNWKINTYGNKDSKLSIVDLVDTPVPGLVMKLENQNSEKAGTVNGPPCEISKPGLYQIGVWAKAAPDLARLDKEKAPTLMILIHQKDWKKSGIKPQNFPLRNGWLHYTVKFQLAENDLPDTYCMRISVSGKGTVWLAGPTFERLSDSASVARKLEPLRETARFSFDKGMSGTSREKNIPPGKNNKTKTANGFINQGIIVEDNGALEYPVENVLKGESGAVSAWIRADFDPPSTFDKSDLIALYIRGKDELKKENDLFLLTVSSPGNILLINSAYGRVGTNYYRTPKQFFKNEWRHFTWCWDKDSGVQVYLDGHLFRTSQIAKERFSALAQLTPESLCLFTATGKNSNQNAVMDEVKLFNRALTQEEAFALYQQYVPFSISLLDYAIVAGDAKDMRLDITCNELSEPVKLTTVVENMGGKKVFEKDLAINKAGPYGVPFKPSIAGDYRLSILYKGKCIRTFEIAVISNESFTNKMPESVTGEVKMKLVDEINCVADYADSRYVDDGNIGVIDSPIGKYREAFGDKKNSGFAYNFDIKSPGKPHWLEVEYPDDKPRAFYVVVEEELNGHVKYSQSGSLNTIGIANGINNPVTGKLATKKLLFWPDAKCVMVGCFVYKPLSGQAGPALSRIRLYEQEGPLPRLKVNTPESLPNRSVGSWNEDPTFPAGIWFKRNHGNMIPDFDFWRDKLKRQVQYLRFTGQNQTVLQFFSYSGDNNGAMTLPSEQNTSGYLPGWGCLAAVTFEREQIPFHIQFNEGVSCSGLKQMVGLDLISENFVEAAGKGGKAVESFTATGEFSIGLNFLHPAVRKAHLRRIRHYRDQFGRNSCFRGILILKGEYLTFRDEKTEQIFGVVLSYS